MDELTQTLLGVMEQAAISGLCRDGQLEMVMQQAHKVDPVLGQEELFRLAESIYELSQEEI